MADPSRPMEGPSRLAAGLRQRPSRAAAAGPSGLAASSVGNSYRQAGAVRRSHPPQCDAGLSEGEVFCFIMAAVAASGVALVVLPLVAGFLVGPSYPTLKVTGLRVSNATWEATLLAEKTGIPRGTYLFYQVECFLYYDWDTTRPFALGSASVEPLVLPTPGSILIEATMRTERSEEEAEAEGSVIRKMDLERRSRGMVVVGLGLRMLGTTEIGPWFKGDSVLIEARCHHLGITFANSSSTEGSLVTSINVGGNPSDNLPSCSYH